MVALLVYASAFLRCEQVYEALSRHAEVSVYLCSLQQGRSDVVETDKVVYRASAHYLTLPVYYERHMKAFLIYLSLDTRKRHAMI